MLWVFLTAVAALVVRLLPPPVTRRPCGMPAGGSHDRLRAAGGTTGHVGLARCRCIAKRQSCEVARGPGRDGSVGGGGGAGGRHDGCYVLVTVATRMRRQMAKQKIGRAHV